MGFKKRENGVRSEFEKDLLKMMIDYDVDQTDLANHEGVTPQAINNRLKRLNNERYRVFKKLILSIAETRNQQQKEV